MKELINPTRKFNQEIELYDIDLHKNIFSANYIDGLTLQ